MGNLADYAALGALFAGVAMRNALPAKMLKSVDSEIRAVSYGLFGPIFFLSVGLSTDV